jgi:hypothetical protein
VFIDLEYDAKCKEFDVLVGDINTTNLLENRVYIQTLEAQNKELSKRL